MVAAPQEGDTIRAMTRVGPSTITVWEVREGWVQLCGQLGWQPHGAAIWWASLEEWRARVRRAQKTEERWPI